MKRGVLFRSARISSEVLLRKAAIAGGREGVVPSWGVESEGREKELMAWVRRSDAGISPVGAAMSSSA
jgi:hypothetical protein